MKYKKQTSDRKRFWLGIASCAMVGFVAYATSYFSSAHVFTNEYKTKKYDVKVYDVFDSKKAAHLWTDITTDLNMDIVVKNSGNVPVFVRIRYFLGWDSEVRQGNPEDIEYYDKETDENGNPLLDENGNYILKIGQSLDMMEGWVSFSLKNTDKFLYNNYKEDDEDYVYDGCYYYKGVLGPGESIQHFEGVISEPRGGGGEFVNSYPSQMYKNIDKDSGEMFTSFTNQGLGKVVIMGSGASIPKYGESISISSIGLRAYVETIQATDKDGNEIKEISDSATAYDMKDYWTALGK